MRKVEIVPQVGHTVDMPRRCVFSPDSRLVATGAASDGVVKLWSVEKGRLLRNFPESAEPVSIANFSADGRWLTLPGSNDRDRATVLLRDVAGSRESRNIAPHPDGEVIQRVLLSADGRRMVTEANPPSSLPPIARVWDMQTGKQVFHSPNARVVLAISPDGQKIAVKGEEAHDRHYLAVVDLGPNGKVRRIRHPRPLTPHAAVFSADSRSLTIASDDAVVRWDLETGTSSALLTRKPNTGRKGPNIAEFARDGGRLVLSEGLPANETIRIVDVPSGSETTVHKGAVECLGITPGGDMLVFSSGRDISLFDLRDRKVARQLKSDVVAIASTSVLQATSRIVLGTSAQPPIQWDLSTGREVQSGMRLIDMSKASAFLPYAAAAYSPDGKWIALSQPDHVRLFDRLTLKVVRTLDMPGQGAPLSISFSPDSRRLAVGGTVAADAAKRNYNLRIFDIPSGKVALNLPGQDGFRGVVAAFSPDGRHVVSSGGDDTLRLWDAESGRLIWRQTIDHGAGRSVTFSRDGRQLISSEYEGFRVRDAGTGRVVRTLKDMGTGGGVFSPDDRSIAAIVSGEATGAAGDIIKVLPADGNARSLVLSGHLGTVRSLEYTQDGKALLSAGEDGSVRVWNARDGRLIASLFSFIDGEWVALTPDGFFDASPNGAKALTVVRGTEAYAIDQFYQKLYRPDLLREALAGDPQGIVRAAAANMSLDIALKSGTAPDVRIVSHKAGTVVTEDRVRTEIEIDNRGGGIGRVEWHVNGVIRAVQEGPHVSAGATLRLTQDLLLPAGESRIEVTAYNRESLVASLPAGLALSRQAAAPTGPGKLYALAIGVNDYWDSRLKLAFAASDARAILDALTRGKGDLYESVETRLLVDADVTPDKIEQAFSDIGARMRPEDMFVLFVAGHGKTVNGTYHFLPRDFRYDGEASIVKAGIGQDRFQSWLARVPAQRSVLLFDTCESGSMLGERPQQRGLERVVAVEKMTRAMGRTIIAASTDDAPALEGYRGHGVFTYSLLRAFGEADANNDGRVDVTELMGFVDRTVPELSFDRFKTRQIPQAKFVGSNFPVTAKVSVVGAAGPAAGGGEAVSAKPTHVVVAAAEVHAEIGGAPGQQKLAPGSLVVVVRTQQGWALVARDGRQVGYVRESAVAQLQ